MTISNSTAMAMNQVIVHNAIAEDSTAAKTFLLSATHGTVGASISIRSLSAILVTF